MRHKKTSHEANVPACEKYSKEICPRRDEQCWYIHVPREDLLPPKEQKSPSNQQQVFQKDSGNPFPPDHLMKQMMETMNTLCAKVELMEKNRRTDKIKKQKHRK